MAWILNQFYSAALTECNSMSVVVPIETCHKETYPVLWLLPPAGRDHTAWPRHVDVDELAEMSLSACLLTWGSPPRGAARSSPAEDPRIFLYSTEHCADPFPCH